MGIRVKNRPEIGQDGQKWVSNGLETGKNGSKMGQKCSETAPKSPRSGTAGTRQKGQNQQNTRDHVHFPGSPDILSRPENAQQAKNEFKASPGAPYRSGSSNIAFRGPRNVFLTHPRTFRKFGLFTILTFLNPQGPSFLGPLGDLPETPSCLVK